MRQVEDSLPPPLFMMDKLDPKFLPVTSLCEGWSYTNCLNFEKGISFHSATDQRRTLWTVVITLTRPRAAIRSGRSRDSRSGDHLKFKYNPNDQRRRTLKPVIQHGIHFHSRAKGHLKISRIFSPKVYIIGYVW